MCSLLELPQSVICRIFEYNDAETLSSLSSTCKIVQGFVEDNRNAFKSKEIYQIDMDRRRIRAWRDMSWCDRIPFLSFEYISKFFKNINVKGLTVNKLDNEICDFLLQHAEKFKFRFEQLRICHSFSVPHSSISRLISAGNCKRIIFSAVQSGLKLEDLQLEGYKNLTTICFEMDDSIDVEFFSKCLEISKATSFMFHGCDKMPQSFVLQIFENFSNGSRKFHCARITTNQNFSIDAIFENLEHVQINGHTWKMKSSDGKEAIITSRGNSFHFFVAFEVDNHTIDNILYPIPIPE